MSRSSTLCKYCGRAVRLDEQRRIKKHWRGKGEKLKICIGSWRRPIEQSATRLERDQAK